MKCARAIVLALFGLAGISQRVAAQEEPELRLEALNPRGWAEYDYQTGSAWGTNGVRFEYAGAIVTADSMRVNEKTGELEAQGGVRIQREEQLWVGEQIIYNYKTRQIEAREFRTGKAPVFVSGEGLHVQPAVKGALSRTNLQLTATNAYVTTDDIREPSYRVRASRITIVPGKKVIARGATLYLWDVPVF